jgi:membrane protein required for colicin V production
MVVLAIVAISAMLAFLRGFVREVMGIGAWVGAAVVAFWGAPSLEPRVREWAGSGEFSAPLAYAAVFLGALILLSIVAGMVGGLVRGAGPGGVDRTLGVLFGLARGAVLVIAAYIGGGFLMPPDRWPDPVQQARVLPYTYLGAVWLTEQLPPQYRPRVAPLAPGRETRAADLLHVPPQGRPTDRVTARP